jgi:hypothetical protein
MTHSGQWYFVQLTVSRVLACDACFAVVCGHGERALNSLPGALILAFNQLQLWAVPAVSERAARPQRVLCQRGSTIMI